MCDNEERVCVTMLRVCAERVYETLRRVYQERVCVERVYEERVYERVYEAISRECIQLHAVA